MHFEDDLNRLFGSTTATDHRKWCPTQDNVLDFGVGPDQATELDDLTDSTPERGLENEIVMKEPNSVNRKKHCAA